MASPQYAIANSGSMDWALRKWVAASSYSKLCSCANARRNSSCASAAPELAKLTIPTSLVLAATRFSGNHVATNIAAKIVSFMSFPTPLLVFGFPSYIKYRPSPYKPGGSDTSGTRSAIVGEGLAKSSEVFLSDGKVALETNDLALQLAFPFREFGYLDQ